MLKHMLCALLTLEISNVFGANMPNQYDQIVYDGDNYIVFEDVGRRTRTSADKVISVTLGRFIRLHVHRDGETYDIDLTNPQYDNKDPRYQLIRTQISEIKYKDKDNVWIISYGHSTSHALLFDIVKRGVVSEYYGFGFTISPDCQKIAHCYQYTTYSTPLQKYERRRLVFVDGTMVYPVVESGFAIWKPTAGTQAEEIRKADGATFENFLKGAVSPPSEMASPISWKESDSITFTVKESVTGTTNTQLVKFVVSGLSAGDSKMDAKNIRVQRMPVPNVK